jgi:hypothetical protein
MKENTEKFDEAGREQTKNKDGEMQREEETFPGREKQLHGSVSKMPCS